MGIPAPSSRLFSTAYTQSPAAEAPQTPARSTGSLGPRRRRLCAPTSPIRALGPTASWATGPGGCPPAPRARRSPRYRGSRRSEDHVEPIRPAADLHESRWPSTSSRVADRDEQSWYAGWCATADRLVQAGDASAEGGHGVSARESYLRACVCYSAAYHPLFGAPVDPRLLEAFGWQRAVFDKAAALMDPPGERLAIGFEGAQLPAYFFRVPGAGAPGPLLVITSGYDSTIYESFFAQVVPALRRGYHCLVSMGRARASCCSSRAFRSGPMGGRRERGHRRGHRPRGCRLRSHRVDGLEPVVLPVLAGRFGRAATPRLRRRSRPAEHRRGYGRPPARGRCSRDRALSGHPGKRARADGGGDPRGSRAALGGRAARLLGARRRHARRVPAGHRSIRYGWAAYEYRLPESGDRRRGRSALAQCRAGLRRAPGHQDPAALRDGRGSWRPLRDAQPHPRRPAHLRLARHRTRRLTGTSAGQLRFSQEMRRRAFRWAGRCVTGPDARGVLEKGGARVTR